MRTRLAISIAVLALLWTRTLADRVTLRDGTVLDGAVIQQGDRFWIRLSDGGSRFVAVNDVVSIAPSRPKDIAAPASQPASQPQLPANLRAVQYQAEQTGSCLAGLAMWARFAGSATNADDRAVAQEQVERWKSMVLNGHEKVGAKWLDADQRKAAINRAAELNVQAFNLANDGKALLGLKKLEEALLLYPNSYPLVFQAGWVAVLARKFDDAILYYEQSSRMRPYAYEPVNNLGVIRITREDFQSALPLFARAAEINPAEAIVKNLAAAVDWLPEGRRGNAKFKEAIELSEKLVEKLKLQPPQGGWRAHRWVFIANRQEPFEGGDAALRGIVAVVSATVVREDGMLLTIQRPLEAPNVHYLVIFDDGTIAGASLAASDATDNLALLRIKPSKPLPPLGVAKTAPANHAAGFAVAGVKSGKLGAAVRLADATAKFTGQTLSFTGTFTAGHAGAAVVDPLGQIVGILNPRTAFGGPDVNESATVGVEKIRGFLSRTGIAIHLPDGRVQPKDAEAIKSALTPSVACVLVVR